jgi:hypothetical protein
MGQFKDTLQCRITCAQNFVRRSDMVTKNYQLMQKAFGDVTVSWAWVCECFWHLKWMNGHQMWIPINQQTGISYGSSQVILTKHFESAKFSSCSANWHRCRMKTTCLQLPTSFKVQKPMKPFLKINQNRWEMGVQLWPQTKKQSLPW